MTQTSLIDRVVLGRYRIMRKLAAGGMGVIYLARSEGAAGFVKPVVIKRIHSDMDQGADRSTGLFIREAQILAAIRHPDVVSVMDFGSEDGAYIMVLEYIHGFHLGQWAKYLRRSKRSMPADIAIHITIRVLDALEYAHNLPLANGERGSVVHRDVTPSNVLLDVNGYLKLADFGVASARTGNSEAMTMSTGQVRGKLSYIAPELFSSGQPSPSTDIYSCGVMLHELLLGRNEFAQKEDAATIHRVLHHHPTPISSQRDDVPDIIDDVLDRALAKDPAKRYASAAEFAYDLRKCLSIPEAEARAELMRRVSEDFRGDIAAVLGTSPLAELERAWRAGLTPEGSHTHDGRGAPEEVTKVAEYASLPPEATLTSPTVVGKGQRPVPPAPPPPVATAPAAGAASPAAAEPSSRRWVVPAVSVVALLLAIGAIVTAKLGSEPPPVAGPSRYIVIENDGARARADQGAAPTVPSPSEPPAAPPAVATAPAAREPAPAATEARRPTSRRSSPATEDPAAARARALTLAFGRQRGRVQACFDAHADAISGNPRIQVRFSIDAAGAVQTVGLEPASLQQTELGRCLVQVARGAQFGPQPGPTSFAIPVTASTR